MHNISLVHLFANGMVMVFDRQGKQIAELQDQYDEVKDKIRMQYEGPWGFGVWWEWMHEGLSFEQIEKTVAQLKACWHE